MWEKSKTQISQIKIFLSAPFEADLSLSNYRDLKRGLNEWLINARLSPILTFLHKSLNIDQ
jgi:hypothetical protein